MYGNRPDPPGQWSVYAEFTISHPGAGDPENIPITRTEHNDNGVRMTYSWNSQGVTDTTSTNAHENRDGAYGFQKGNLLFTATPPSRRPEGSRRSNAQESSGYSSNLLSPNSVSSFASIQHQNGRKCRSTCNITLCPSSHHQCGRTQSLRCQTPSSRSDFKNPYYGCGDPWCHHARSVDEFSIGGRCSPVLETCEDCQSLSERSKKATRSLSRELDARKDVSVQTSLMVDKCTSPFQKIHDELQESKVTSKKVKRRSLSSYQRRPEPIYQRSHSPSSFTPDSLESGRIQPTRRLTRSPRLKKIPHVKTDTSEQTTTTTDDKSNGSKKPRTVHIDVYCTGSEAETDSSNSDFSSKDSASTPQTVYESEQVRITHKRAEAADLPISIKETADKTISPKGGGSVDFPQHSLEKSDSDFEDSLSTAYPSKLSSYSNMKDYASSISSVPRSWTNYSMSSCAVPDTDYDSVANTSWKDITYSDLDSILQSRSSIAGTESLLFVPRKLQQKNSSIDETPELLDVDRAKSPGHDSLQMSDSFEYANSEDRLRIKRMEEILEKEEERKRLAEKNDARHREQERKMNEYLQKKLKRLSQKESRDSDSDDSADSGKGWTFVKDDNKKLERDSTVRRHSKDSRTETKKEVKPHTRDLTVDKGSLSDSSPSPSCRTPSSVALIQKLSLNPALRAPFTIAPGQYTEQRTIAKKFGPVISAFRKPGHHVGPVRNPECACAHCKSYYESVGFRSRTRSLGDPPTQNWRC